jgi:cytochrome c oxidase subunit 4
MSVHVVPVRTYVTIFLLLMVLTATTVWIANVDLGSLNTLVALTIAVIKMLLVVLFFMHVRSASGLTKTIIVAGFFWLMLLMAFTLTDEGSRNIPPQPEGWGTATVAPAAKP